MGIPKSKERARVEEELLTKGWGIVSGQPDRTLMAARGLLFAAADSLGLQGGIRTEMNGNQALGYIPTIVKDNWEKELPEGW